MAETSTITVPGYDPFGTTAFSVNTTFEYVNETEPNVFYPPSGYSTTRIIICSLLAALVIILILFGNILVCIAVFRDRSLKAVQNWFLVSLAASDLMVGVLIMPLGVVNEMLGHWVFGNLVCLVWLVLDVLACTASILNLCLISIDRYCSITRPIKHAEWRHPTRIRFMICMVWGLSMIISVPPLFGWRSEVVPDQNGFYKCVISEEIGYIIFSTMCSFYIPAFIMVIVYWKIWLAAKRRARSNTRISQRVNGKSSAPAEYMSVDLDDRTSFQGKTYTLIRKAETDIQLATVKPDPSQSGTCASNNNSNAEVFDDKSRSSSRENFLKPTSTSTSSTLVSRPGLSQSMDLSLATHRPSRIDPLEIEKQKRRLAQYRDRRATIVLGVIMGTFLACWYPFFQLYVISALCGEACKIPKLLFDFFFWVGYCNSALNPIIYTIFNRDFRRAFKRMLGFKTKR